MIERVAIVGGTHGNELTGVHLVQQWRQRPEEVARASFSTQLLMGNQRSVDQNKRYIDKDLNRCFGSADILDELSTAWEVQRARELHKELGPKGLDSRCDFLIDLHTSTSNCGAMIILVNASNFNLRLAAYLSQKIPSAKVVHFPAPADDSPYMGSLCERALGVEVGPIAQGLLRHDVYALSESIVQHALDFAQISNEGSELALPTEMLMYRFAEVLAFPSSEGGISGMIHQDLQDKDYQPLTNGQPVFQNMDGRVIPYDGVEGLCPVFINEAAYYPDQIALNLTEKIIVDVPNSERL